MIVAPRQIRVYNGRIYTAGSECPDDPVVVNIEPVKVEEIVEVVEEVAPEVEIPTDSHTEEAVKPKFNKKKQI
jgi:hypothetical protein